MSFGMIRVALVYANLLLAGCAFQAPAVVHEPVENPAMEYFFRAAAFPESTVRAELAALDRQDGLNPLVRSVRQALLLSVPEGAGPDDLGQALRLLRQAVASPYATDDESRQYQQFARVWLKVLEKRVEREQSIRDLDAELKAKQADLRALEEKNAARDRRVQELNVQIEALHRQIEELKLIEQQIHDREQSLDKPGEVGPGG